MVAFNQAYCRVLFEWFPSISNASLSVTLPSVIVPVLSEQRIFIQPKFSMEASRFTITCCFAIALAPTERFTLIIAGNNCGVKPTANANENKKESNAGLCNRILMAKITSTNTNVICISR